MQEKQRLFLVKNEMIFLTYRLRLFNTDNLVDMVECSIFVGE